MLYKVVLTFESVDESVTIQIKTTEKYFPLVRFILLYKEVLTLESMGEILNCDNSNESYWAVISCGQFPVRGVLFSMLYLLRLTLKEA